MFKKIVHLSHKELILYGILSAWFIIPALGILPAYLLGDYVSVGVILYSMASSILIYRGYKKTKNMRFYSILLLWAITLSIWILVILNKYDLDVVLTIFTPLMGSLLLNRRDLIVHGLSFLLFLTFLIGYGFIMHPEYVLFSNPLFFISFVTILFFTLSFAVVYHFFIESSYQKILASNKEKEILLQEVHHRVKNNLNMMSSVLALQARTDNEEILSFITTNRQRLDSIAMVHELLYSSEDFNHIKFSAYVKKLSKHLIAVSSSANIKVSIDENAEEFSLDIMSHLGLILQELITNSLKYALEKGGEISIKLEQISVHEYILYYADSGISLIESKKKKQKERPLGIRLIELKTQQLGGDMQLNKCNGYSYTIRFHSDRN